MMAGDGIDFRDLARRLLRQAMAGDLGGSLSEGFDEQRRADTRPATRGEVLDIAHVVFHDFPGNSLYGRQDLWQAALDALDRIAAWARDDGTWDWYVAATGKVHRNVYAGPLHAWLTLLEHYAAQLGEARVGRLRHAFAPTLDHRHRAAEAFLDEPATMPTGLNLFVHWMSELIHGGRLYGRQDWLERGRRVMQTLLDRQTVDGYWPDSPTPRGPVGNYNIVTLAAFSAHRRVEDSPAVRTAIERAADYHLAMSYPDGSGIETADERNRYRPDFINPKLVWQLLHLPSTQRHAAYFARQMQRKHGAQWTQQLGAGLWLARMLEDLPAQPVAPLQRDDFTRLMPSIPALIVRRGPWQYCLSAATTTIPGGVYHLDLQQHLSVWHDDHGLLIGGGNSLHDPAFSSAQVAGQYLACRGELFSDEQRLRLHFGAAVVQLQLQIRGDRELALRCWVENSGALSAQAAVMLPGANLGDSAFTRRHGLDHQPVQVGALSFAADCAVEVSWPHAPVDIYNPPARLGPEHRCARIAVDLAGQPIELRINLLPTGVTR